MPINSQPLISVVIPCYNHENFIIDCLESVKGDPYERIEIVFLDDGSSDNSYELGESWLKANKNSFEKVSYSKQSNQGICKTFNTIVRKSSGDFIFILASDDLAAANGISNTLRYYNRHCSEPTLLFTDLELIDYDGRLFAKSGTAHTHRDAELLENKKEYLKLDLLVNWGIPYMQQFYPRELFDLHGGYSEKLKCEDYYFALKNIVGGSVAYGPVVSRKLRLKKNANDCTPGLTHNDYIRRQAHELLSSKMPFRYQLLINLLNNQEQNRTNCTARAVKYMIHLILRFIMKLFRTYYKAYAKLDAE
jgi:glycosyltransferase involved in cell wall biosynthesis